MGNDAFVIGLDFGTDSVRAVVVNARNGNEVAAAVCAYPRWRDGLFAMLPLTSFDSTPLDYIESLEKSIKECLRKVGATAAANIKGISVDTTGSTPIAVDSQGTPLSLLPGYERNPNAMFVLWKDHTAVAEAAEINAHALKFETNYLKFVGGIYSSEWFWAKLLHVLRVDSSVRNTLYSWVEHCDWIPFLLTGGSDVSQMKRGVCSAGHKALWAESFDGLPPDHFFATLDPLLAGFTSKLFRHTHTADQSAGRISESWAQRLGLPKDVIVGVGAFDCHMGAVGGQIEPYFLSKVMGTSTCDMMVIPRHEMGDKLVKGICGQVDGSVIPGMIGLEAGQSAFGDTYAWYKELLMWPIRKMIPSAGLVSHETADLLIHTIEQKMIATLSEEASKLPVTEESELALDWLNGRRTPDADQSLKAAMSGLSLGSDAPRLFRAWVEATCFGAKAIVERFNQENVPVKGLIGLGGVARKSPYIMQTMADVMNMPIKIHRSEQTCALGASMFAATAAGLYRKVEDAMHAMGPGFDMEFKPNPAKASMYKKRYSRFVQLGQSSSQI